ncbi:MAG: FAD-dependent oxidoreductase [Actinomycetota bacterium]|nr:FAD-dependent oxidoreductase [Actinomycetota bacterium]
MSAASEARRADSDLEIVAFEKGGFASYSQCGLPYLVGGVVGERGRLIARTIEQFEKRGIEVRLRHEVTAIDPERRTVRVLNDGAETEERYDRLLIATGASPVGLTIPGIGLSGVFNLDVMEDAISIQDHLRKHRPKRAVIAGGGYIGLEMAENLVRLGMHVTLVQRGDQLFSSVDTDVAAPIDGELERHGVDVSLCDTVVQACEGSHGRVTDVLTSEGAVPADLVVMAVGVRPSVGLVRSAGVALGETGAIAVDERLRTNVPDVYAAGDCAEHYHRLLGRPAWVPLGTTANKQGRVAGRNAAGGDEAFSGILGTAITRVFDLEVARTGFTEGEAKAEGLDYVATTLDSRNHAGYMPDAKPLTVKLVAEKGTGRLLGAQAVGRGGADKRIDVAAAALYAGLTVEDLTRLDLEYAPPFNGVWDPLQVAATALLRQGL